MQYGPNHLVVLVFFDFAILDVVIDLRYIVHVTVAFKIVNLFVLDAQERPDPAAVQLKNPYKCSVADTCKPGVVIYVDKHCDSESRSQDQVNHYSIVVKSSAVVYDWSKSEGLFLGAVEKPPIHNYVPEIRVYHRNKGHYHKSDIISSELVSAWHELDTASSCPIKNKETT